MTTSQSGQDSSKSKFQIRSIVEIYENQSESQQQQQQDIDLSYKTATHVQETVLKEIINEPVLKGNKTDTESRTEIISLLFLFSTHVIKCYKYILEFYVLFFFFITNCFILVAHFNIYTLLLLFSFKFKRIVFFYSFDSLLIIICISCNLYINHETTKNLFNA